MKARIFFHVIVGFLIMALLDWFENPVFYLISIPFSILFGYMIPNADWLFFLKLVFKLFSRIPLSIFEGFDLLIRSGNERFEIRDVKRDEETIEVLCTTLTPKSIVFMSDGDRTHVHVIGV